MATLTNLMFKTKGWKIDATTLAGFSTGASLLQAEADYCDITRDGRIAFAELSNTDLTGIEIKREVLFPQGVSIQEPFPVNGFMDHKDSFQTNPGLGAEVFCYDLWSTKKLQQEDFDAFVNKQNYTGYTQQAPGFLSTIDILPPKTPYWDQEQVIYGRSRYWFPSANFDRGITAGTNVAVRKFQFSKMFDSTWGLMEPIACSILHHARIWIFSYPIASGTPGEWVFDESSAAFYTLPMSNQPMVTMRDDPGFIERMTMERRSRDV